MSPAVPTKIFGIKIGIDPKFLVGGLVAVAALLFWLNSRSDSDGAPNGGAGEVSRAVAGSAAPAPTAASRTTRPFRRNTNLGSERSVLAVRPVDPTKGEVDPTLRLDLLSRLRDVQPGPIGRSIFEIGSTPQSAALLTPIKAPKIPVGPIVNTPPPPPPPMQANIPFKYYGYAKPQEKRNPIAAFFLDGDNVLVAVEGQTLKGRYLVVELTPNSARMEDTQIKKGQILPVVPQAQQQ